MLIGSRIKNRQKLCFAQSIFLPRLIVPCTESVGSRPTRPDRRPPFSTGPRLHRYLVLFIDISLNISTTLEHIYSLLRPGGTWINPGPLLWTAASGGQSKLELSLEVVLQAVEVLIFFIDPREDGQRTTTVECEYTGDAQAMMR
ncbi:hypothetical protein R3P38DRAFT_1188009 [Favolaschia claudopus]|uniref:Uncharacterized protein n=1 Tax=Favolaschia claudopus TaxID=2862362 RepID=A0AAW0E220_9AGAR